MWITSPGILNKFFDMWVPLNFNMYGKNQVFIVISVFSY